MTKPQASPFAPIVTAGRNGLARHPERQLGHRHARGCRLGLTGRLQAWQRRVTSSALDSWRGAVVTTAVVTRLHDWHAHQRQQPLALLGVLLARTHCALRELLDELRVSGLLGLGQLRLGRGRERTALLELRQWRRNGCETMAGGAAAAAAGLRACRTSPDLNSGGLPSKT